jgi:putative transposase
MVSKTDVWKWVRKFGERVNVKPSRMVRRLIALDETCVKVNGLEYWVYAALDVDRNEILSMRVYPSRNALASEQFICEVLKYCDGKPTFIVDNAPWLKQSLEELGLPYNAEPFRR